MADCGRLAVLLLLVGIASGAVAMRSERFVESLVVRPLADGSVLSHFDFVNELGGGSGRGRGRHHKLFPKAVLQVVQEFGVRELELGFTQGRWDERRWGALEGAGVKPGGLELRTQFHPGVGDVDVLWRNVTHALSGLFCASVNFLEDAAMVAEWERGVGSGRGAVRRGALPREAVCTENLTPWLKLLPCRDRAGLSTLLERPRIHNGAYYSLRVVVTTGDGTESALRLSQTLTVVLKPGDRSRGRENRLPNWSLSSLFGRPLVGSCPVASSSHVHLALETNLVDELKRAAGMVSKGVQAEDFDVNSSDVFTLNVAPDKVSKGSASLFLDYDLQRWSQAHPLDVGMSWRASLAWAPRLGSFRASQFLAGRGNGRGAIVSLVNANGRDGWDGVSSVDVTMFQIVPWYVRLYMHTLKVVVDGERVQGVRLKLSPANDRKSPAVVEIGVTIPRNASLLVLSVEFDKGYLRIDEHPPDANRGFDLPSALFTFASGSDCSQVQVYSDNLLVLLATPDFSMPYNVITFTMTALALYFGSLLNSLRLRSVTEDQVQQPSSRISTKLKNLLARFRGREKVKTL